jgi:hypothetical protein
VIALFGVGRDCMAMISASLLVANELCRRISHAYSRTRRSIGAIRAPFRLPPLAPGSAVRLLPLLAEDAYSAYSRLP